MDTRKINPNKKYIELVLAFVIAILSFIGGRATVEPIGKPIYVKGETIRDTVPLPVVSKEYYTKEIVVPMKKDTDWLDGKPVFVYMKVDTAAIIADYTIKREYVKTLFDNQKNGKLSVGVKLQYNKLQDNITYDYVPMIEKIKVEKLFVPHVDVSWNSFGYVGAGGGVYYHNIGIGGKYITNFKEKGFEVNTSIKF